MTELLARLRDWSYLRKSLVLGVVIGVVAGFGAISFIFAIEGASKLLLETTAPWPRGSFALSIDRSSQLIVPRPETALQAGDAMVAVVPSPAESEPRRRSDGGAPQ